MTEQLRERLLGEIICPDDAAYDEARGVHNGLIDRRPAMVVRCRGAADVVAAIGFAREQGWFIAVRGGGHSVAGHGTCDDGMVIDLSLMRGVHVDPVARTVRVQGGALLADVDRETQLFGLATPTGQVSVTGIAGLALNGGMGMLQRKYGLTCDNLVSADVVTADGRLITTNETSHPELFWALRGAGGNFGVVTSFEFRLHPVGPIMVGGLVAWPVDRAAEVLGFLRDFMLTAPEELSADGIFQCAPPLPAIPAELHGTPLIGIFVRHSGTVEQGLADVVPIQQFGDPLVNVVGPMPYIAVQSMLDPLNPKGWRNYWTGEYVAQLGPKEIATIAEHGSALPTHSCIVQVIPFNAAVTRVAPDATAFVHRADSWLIHYLAQWSDPADTERCRHWARTSSADLRVFGTGEVYLNLVSDDEDVDRVRAFWNDQRLERLGRIKAEYDPDNLFRFNHNIEPRPAEPS